MRLRRTLDDGIFFDSCDEATDHWDEDWVVCPVCAATIDFVVDDEGESYIAIEHQEVCDVRH